MNIKKPMLAVAALSVIGVGAMGSATYALEDSATGEKTSMVDKLVSKFNLDKTEVETFFKEERAAHDVKRSEKMTEKLAEAVKDSTITQEQSDYITKAMTEIDVLRSESTPGEQDDTTRDAMKEKRDALRDWAKENDVELNVLGGKGHRGGNQN